jgi:hypothetical protein
LIQITDQDTIAVDFNPILTASKTKLYLDFDKKHESEYSIELLPKTITDILGLSNDSISVKLKTKTPEDYGVINIELVSAKKISFIVELLDEKETPVRLVKVSEPQTVSFKLLSPGNYLVRVTLDENNNGIWDTGSFLDKRQPELVKYYNEIIELRANWEINETFILD